MNIGKTLFAQLMDFLPWSTFSTGLSHAMKATAPCERCLAPHSTR